MSLQIWLPLNGNFDNQGVCEIDNNVLADGNYWDGPGKTCAQALHLTKKQVLLNGASSPMAKKKQFSYCYWVKIVNAWTTQWLDGITWTSTTGSSSSVSRQEFYTNCTRVGTWYAGGSNNPHVFTPGVWTHIAATYDYTTGIVKFYLNGILQKTTTDLNTDHYLLGNLSIGDNGVDILQNDVRIYDHVLSSEEVHEIAQGLILHYKLDGFMQGANDNFIVNGNAKQDNTYWEDWGPDAVSNRTIETINGKKWFHFTASGGETRYGGYYQDDRSNTNQLAIKPDTDYTLSVTMFASAPTQGVLWSRYHANSTASAARNKHGQSYLIDLTTEPKRFTITFNSGSNDDYYLERFTVMIGVYHEPTLDHEVYFTDVKFEEGKKATNYTPCSTEFESENKVVDSSGFNNTGEITGDLTSVLDCPRYYSATHFDGTNYILTPQGSFDWNDRTVGTISVWLRPTSSISSYSGGVGIGVDSNTRPKCWVIMDYKNTFCVNYQNGSKYTYISSGITLPLNEWHHCAATVEDTTVKLYFDGELVKTDSFDWGTASLESGARFQVGIVLPGSDETFYGDYSDVRFYCTALSDEDVKKLYNVRASVDNLGGLHTFELLESDEVQINSQGITKSGEFNESVESFSNAKILKTGEWQVHTLVEK